MKRTIASSFLFIVPINMLFRYGYIFRANLFALALGLSVANHSHVGHSDPFRRNLFMTLDTIYMPCFAVYMAWSLRFVPWLLAIQAALMGYLWLGPLSKGGVTRVDQYTELQKDLHVLFHFVAILGFTALQYIQHHRSNSATNSSSDL